MQGTCSKVCAISDGEAPQCDRKLLSLMAEILFMENSRPMHRQLLSGLHRMPARRFEVFKECVKLKVCLCMCCSPLKSMTPWLCASAARDFCPG